MRTLISTSTFLNLMDCFIFEGCSKSQSFLIHCWLYGPFASFTILFFYFYKILHGTFIYSQFHICSMPLLISVHQSQNERIPSWNRTREKTWEIELHSIQNFIKLDGSTDRNFCSSDISLIQKRIGESEKKSQMSININSSDSLITLLSLFHGRLLRFWSSDQNRFPSFKVKKFSLGMARILYPAGAPTGYPVEKFAG